MDYFEGFQRALTSRMTGRIFSATPKPATTLRTQTHSRGTGKAKGKAKAVESRSPTGAAGQSLRQASEVPVGCHAPRAEPPVVSLSLSGSHAAGSQDFGRTNFDLGCDEWGCGFFGPETVKDNSGGAAINQRRMKDVAEIAKKEEEEDKKKHKEAAWVPRPLTTEEQARTRAGSRGLSMLTSEAVMGKMLMKRNGKGGGSPSRMPSTSTPASSRRRPETYEIGSPNVKRGRELGEDPIGTPTSAGVSRPVSSEAEAAALAGEATGGGGLAPVPTDLEDTDSTLEKELLAASRRVEAANARVDVATANQRAPESSGKVRRVEGGGFGVEGDEEGGGVSPTQPFFQPETQGQGWPLPPTQAAPNPCDDVSMGVEQQGKAAAAAATPLEPRLLPQPEAVAVDQPPPPAAASVRNAYGSR